MQTRKRAFRSPASTGNADDKGNDPFVIDQNGNG